MHELEIVQYLQVDGLRLFLNTVYYRTPHLHSEERFYSREDSLAILEALYK